LVSPGPCSPAVEDVSRWSCRTQPSSHQSGSVEYLSCRGLRDGMKRWMNGLPGANQETGCHDGPTRSFRYSDWVRADTHVGPAQNAPLQRSNTLLQHSRWSLSQRHLAPHGRVIHFSTTRNSEYVRLRSAILHITDISSWPRRPVLKFVSNKHP